MNLNKIVQFATLIGLAFSAGMFYMDAHSFKEDLNTKKHDRELQEFKDDLKKVPGVSSDFNPTVETEIKDFDFIMNLKIDENNGLGKLKMGL